MGRQWTEDQQAAITARGGTVLVSAAAGSGKTAVLVERLIGRITDQEHPIDADRFLVVTFTKAAAAEMRERVSERLRERLKENPTDPFLQHQLMLLERTQICTIDSFFGAVVRENFEQLSVSPNLRVVDDALLARLKNETVEELLEENYREAGDDFLLLVRYFGEENDTRLKAEIIKLYEKIRSLPYPFRWMEEQLVRYEGDLPLKETDWGKQLLLRAQNSVLYCVNAEKRALAILAQNEGLKLAYSPAYLDDLSQLLCLQELCKNGKWDELYDAIGTVSFARLSRAPTGTDPFLKEKVGAYRKSVKDEIDFLRKIVAFREEAFLEDQKKQIPLLRELFRLTRAFYERLDQEKNESNVADFNDFAYLTLQLVADEEGRRTPFAETFSMQYEEILLDEYQDTNRLQNLIFQCISQDGKNLFLVGDLKQSIYRFRNASPEIFMEKKQNFPPYDGKKFPSSIYLSKNFRSRKGVTEGINAIFSKLMSPTVGNVQYDELEKLNCGAVYPEIDGTVPEMAVQLIDMNQSEMENRRILVEARQTAKQIKKMIKEEVLVTENGGLRPCRGGDFVILLRSQKNTDILFAEALEQENIDSLLGASSGYFSSREVSVMISLLQILDNPILNIPMAAVLLSPMFSFSCDELAALTLYHPERSFYAALLLEAGKGKRKAREFVRIFDLLRAKSAVMNIQKLIQYIYDTTDFMEVMSSFSGASEREANLKLLLKYALDYEASGNHELSGFVSYLDYLIENGKDFEVANPLNEAAHSVRIMTIHKSKGLEFPIVIVANCSKRHNTQDLIGSTVLDMTLGLGMKFIDRDHLRQYETIPYLAIQSFEQQNMLSEEMRLLYVALTRAKEKLILNVTEENLGRKLQKLETYFDTEGNISPYSVGKAQSYSDWILMALLGHPAFSAVRQQYDIWIPQNSETCSLQLFETAVEKVEITEESAVELSAPSDPQKMESMDYQIHYCYPYLTETRTPAKLSVTEITHPPEEETLLSPPKFMGEKEFTSAQKGSIFHRVLQFCDFHAGQLDAQAELDRLTALRFLTPKEQAAVNLQKLELFFSSSLMSRILGADRVLREYKFFDTIPAKEAGFDGNAPILVQGIADCILVENGKGVIIDFKTDAVSSPDILEKRYAGQLTLYRRALQNVFPNGIGECILYSVHLGTEIIVKTQDNM